MLEVREAVGVVAEDVDGPHAALRDVVRQARHDETGHPGHARDNTATEGARQELLEVAVPGILGLARDSRYGERVVGPEGPRAR